MKRQLVCSAGAVALSALAYGALYPPFGQVWLSWLAVAPLLLAVRTAAPLRAAGLAALWAYLSTLIIIAWLVPTLHGHFQRSLVTSVAFLLGFGLVAASPFYALSFAAYAYARRRLAPVAQPWLLVASWVCAEWLRTQLLFRSPWAALGHAHFASARLRQVADLTGVYGVSAVVVAGNVALAFALLWLWRSRPRTRAPREELPVRTAIALAIAAALASQAYGEWRLRELGDRERSASSAPLTLMLVQGNVPVELRWKRSAAGRVVRKYVSLTRDALQSAEEALPDLVIWPENAIQVPLDDGSYAHAVTQLPRSGVPLLLGVPRHEMRNGVAHHFNSAALLREGSPPVYYDKRILLPFSETKPFGRLGSFGTSGDLAAFEYTSGRRAGVFPMARHTLGVLICLEALYPRMGRDAVSQGASVLVNLSNDGWYRGEGGAEQHLAHVVFRAIETRRPLIRATTTGISAVVDAKGSVVAQLDSGIEGVLRAELPVAVAEPSLYTRTGDAFALTCLGSLLAAVLVAALRGRESRRVSLLAPPIRQPTRH